MGRYGRQDEGDYHVTIYLEETGAIIGFVDFDNGDIDWPDTPCEAAETQVEAWGEANGLGIGLLDWMLRGRSEDEEEGEPICCYCGDESTVDDLLGHGMCGGCWDNYVDATAFNIGDG